MAFKRQDALCIITEGLSLVATECKLRGVIHLFDAHTVSHEFYRRLLSAVYDLDLVVLDRIDPNFPAIDLGDEKKKRAFQITADKRGDKIQKTLDMFVKHKLAERFEKVQVVVLGERQGSYDSLTVPAGLPFAWEEDILDISGLVREIEKLDTEKLESIAEIVRSEIKIGTSVAASQRRVIRVLFLAANPAGTSQQYLASGLSQVTEQARSTPLRQSLDLRTWWSAGLQGMVEAIFREQPAIIHFTGEASDQLLLEHHDGVVKPVADDDLRGLFSRLRGYVRLVIVNTCLSASQAKAIQDEVECTVSIHLDRSATVAFSADFYGSIASGKSIQSAYDHALGMLKIGGHAAGLPELFCRPDADPSAICLVQAPQGKREPEHSIRFVQLEMATEHCLWEEMRHFRSPEAPPYSPMTGRPWFNQTYSIAPKEWYPFGSHQIANYHWPIEQRNTDNRVADPIIDFTLLNGLQRPCVLSRIGIRPVNKWNAAKAAPMAVKLTTFDFYELVIDSFDIAKDVLLPLKEPVYLEPDAPCRVRLRLKDYGPAAAVNETVTRGASPVQTTTSRRFTVP